MRMRFRIISLVFLISIFLLTTWVTNVWSRLNFSRCQAFWLCLRFSPILYFFWVRSTAWTRHDWYNCRVAGILTQKNVLIIPYYNNKLHNENHVSTSLWYHHPRNIVFRRKHLNLKFLNVIDCSAFGKCMIRNLIIPDQMFLRFRICWHIQMKIH